MKFTKSDWGVVLVLALVIAAVVGIFAMAQEDNTRKSEPKQEVVSVSAPKVTKLPTTLAGYKRAFATLPAERWGGGDVAVTTVLSDGRAVWFFGDTLTKRGGITWLNRNTALTQTGEHMRVVNDGVQIIPSEKHFVYWPGKVDEVRPGLLKVWTSMVRVGKGGPWNFERVNVEQSRVALVKIDKAGDMDFVKWAGWVKNPTDPAAAPEDGSDVRIIGPGHWAYQKITHYDMPLSNGQHLVTESQNWDDGHENTLDYRPLLSSR